MFTPQTFNIPELKGISKITIEEHIKLYEGYVKNTNTILTHISDLLKDSEKFAYELGELQRRFSFEFDGMRNHEYYFEQLEGGPTEINESSVFAKKVTESFGSTKNLIERLSSIALTRGIGWSMLYFDKKTNQLLTAWVDEQHMGHLTGLAPIVAIDVWEHSYVLDYKPSGKKNYVSDYVTQINWSVVEKRFENALI